MAVDEEANLLPRLVVMFGLSLRIKTIQSRLSNPRITTACTVLPVCMFRHWTRAPKFNPGQCCWEICGLNEAFLLLIRITTYFDENQVDTRPRNISTLSEAFIMELAVV